MNQMLSQFLSLVSWLGAFLWMAVALLVWSLVDLLRWHPRQTLTVAGAFFGTLMVGIWLSLE